MNQPSMWQSILAIWISFASLIVAILSLGFSTWMGWKSRAIAEQARDATLYMDLMSRYRNSPEIPPALHQTRVWGESNEQAIREYINLTPRTNGLEGILDKYPLEREFWYQNGRVVKMYFKAVYDLYRLRFISRATFGALLGLAGYEVLWRFARPMDYYVFFNVRRNKLTADKIEELSDEFQKEFSWYSELQKLREQ
jgi:hypothetical protein